MREGKPSRTAAAVSAARAAGPMGVDPFAADLLPRAAAWFVRASARAPQWVTRVVSLGLTDHARLRTRAIDGEVATARPSQLVILGAGLDTRAFRMPELKDTHVFEVDHPASQAYKRHALGTRRAPVRKHTFVSVDFARNDLDDALEASGHDAQGPTFWIWEGVTMYLERAALRATLDVIAKRTASGSRAVISYVTPQLTPVGGPIDAVVKVVFRAAGEPFAGLIATEELHRALAPTWTVVSDEGPPEWAARFEPDTHHVLHVVRERVVVARR